MASYSVVLLMPEAEFVEKREKKTIFRVVSQSIVTQHKVAHAYRKCAGVE